MNPAHHLQLNTYYQMILTPHILIGAAIGSRFVSPLAVIGLSILAHFIMDSIPHHEYNIDIIKNNKKIFYKRSLISYLKVAADFSIGLAIASFFIWQSPKQYLIITGIIISLFPDFLLFLNYKFSNLPLISQVALFHKKIHIFKKITRPNFLGLATQIIIILLALIVLSL